MYQQKGITPMSILVSELTHWLETVPKEAEVGIDDGGLSLQVVGSPLTYLEVGGLPNPTAIERVYERTSQ